MVRLLQSTRYCILFFTLLLGVWFSLQSPAQVATATISGVVSDATGAVVPGATITLRNVETGARRTVTTDATGRYAAPQLGVGGYEVTATATGFQTLVRRGITLTVGREAEVNFSLSLGTVAERIEVTGEAPLVETTTATTSGLVDEKTVRELPLNGRSFTDLMDLQANVKNIASAAPLVGGAGTRMWGIGAKFSVAGAHPGQNNYIVDGLIINDTVVATPGSAAGGLMGTDTIREFRLLTSNYSAEYGQVAGGIMTAVTRSGTNTLHGSAFEFLRNSALDARDFFDKEVPPFKRNQFGFTLGGPIQQDRTFFFGSYEGLRQRLGTNLFMRVPTLAARRGILPSGPCAAGCTVGPTAQKVLNLYPLPTPGGRDFGDGTADFQAAPSNPTTEDYFTVRLDHTFSEKHFLFGRYSFSDANSSIVAPDELSRDARDSRYQHLSLSFTSLLTSTLLNNFRAGVGRSVSIQDNIPTGKADLAPLMHVPGRPAGYVNVSPLSGLGPWFGNPNFLWWTSYQYADDVTYTRGNHSVKLGASLQRNHDNQDGQFAPGGQWTFLSLDNFYAENPRSILGSGPASDAGRGWRSWIIGTYLQDDWKVRPNLTLNLGVRFEVVTVPTEVNGRIAQLRDIVRDPATVVGSPFWEQRSAFAHFAPRVGFAWDPFRNGKTAVRGGFGIFQQAIRNTDFLLPGDRMPPLWDGLLLISVPGRPLSYPLVFPNLPPGRVAPSTGAALRLDSLDFHLAQPYSMNWNLSMQQEVFPNTLLNVGYVGSRGVNLLGSILDANSPPNIVGADGRRYIPLGTPRLNPNFGVNRWRTNGNDSYYNSLQVSVEKRFSRGFQISSSYTWSKSIDTNPNRVTGGDFDGSSNSGEQFPFDTKAERALSPWDLRHYWSMNYVYDLPFGPGRALGGSLTGAAGKLLGGWSLSGVVTATTGPPFTAHLNGDFAAALPQGLGTQRPDQVRTPTIAERGTPQYTNQYYDPTAFVMPPLTPQCAATPTAIGCPRRVFGTVGRGIMTGPGLATWNFNVSKTTSLTERVGLQFRAEFFNLLNRANFRLPDASIFLPVTTSPNPPRNVEAGRITRNSTTSREIQFGLKLVF